MGVGRASSGAMPALWGPSERSAWSCGAAWGHHGEQTLVPCTSVHTFPMGVMESVPECLFGVHQYSSSRCRPNPTLVATVLAQTWPFQPVGQLGPNALFDVRAAALPPLTFTAIPDLGSTDDPVYLPSRWKPRGIPEAHSRASHYCEKMLAWV
jgi:hypothetical protein